MVYNAQLAEIIYLPTYFLINFIELPTDQQAVKQEFEKFCAYCLRFSEYLPIVFILGFFVSTIVSRWWDQFCSLPNPEQIAMKVVNFLPAKVIHTVYILTQQDLSLVFSYSLCFGTFHTCKNLIPMVVTRAMANSSKNHALLMCRI